MSAFDLTYSKAKEDVISSPIAKRQRTDGFQSSRPASSDDSDDDPFAGLGAAPSKHFTQPTQIINDGTPKLPSSPRHHSPVHDTPRGEKIQVPASSPFQNRNVMSSNENAGNKRPRETSARASMIAPAGTSFRPPAKAAPTIIDLEDDDGPKYQGGDSDSDIEEISSADIKPSMFKSSGKISMGGSTGAPGFKSLMSTFAHPISSRVTPVMQSGPARAMPVGEEMTLADIRDPTMVRKIERMLKTVGPQFTVREAVDALKHCHGRSDEAELRMVNLRQGKGRATGSSAVDKGLAFAKALATPKPAFHKPPPPPPSTMKRTLGAPVGSIAQRYQQKQEAVKGASAKIEDERTPEKPKRKLMQGRRNPVDDTPEKPVSSPAKKAKKYEDIEEIGGNAFSDAEDYDTQDGSDAEIDMATSDKVLKYLNKCELKDLVELTNVKESVVEFFLTKRPFKTLDKAREVSDAKDTKTGRKSARAPIGDRIVDNAWDMMVGYEAVDELVAECATRGKVIAKEMETWGFNVFGGAKGELEMTSMGEDGVHDSGIGTPTSKMSEMGDDDVKVVTKRKPKFLQKPSIMADSLVLNDYQYVGLNWLHMMYKQKNSCILADDMGLGKTCQVIAFISQLVMEGHNGPHLIIVPPSTLDNWMAEIERFSPQVFTKTKLYRGSQPERNEIAAEVLDNPEDWNIVLSTYDMAHKPQDNKFMRRLRPDVCVYDEGHMLKNPKSLKYQGLMKIGGKFRLLLTGTPLQNNLMELTALLAFILPDLFQEKQESLDYIFRHKASTKDADHAALLSAQRVNRAKSMLTPFVLRRKKAQVMKNLPAKTCRVEYCSLLPTQAELYNSFKTRAIDRARIVAEGGKVPLNLKKDNNNPMMQLRKAAIHPMLFRRWFTDDKLEEMVDLLMKYDPTYDQPRDKILLEMQRMNDYELHDWCIKTPCIEKFDVPHQLYLESGKVEALVKLLKQYQANGDRVLVFSQFVIVLNVLEGVFTDPEIAISFSRIDGSTRVDERQPLIDQFKNDESITAMLLSTGAGGTGINLMMANKVIIFDGSFNPQDDVQAENRAHRVGQTRDVEVVRLVTKGTIEEQIYRLGQSKLELDNKVVGEEGEVGGFKAVSKMMLEDEAGKTEEGGKAEGEEVKKQSS